MYSNCKQYSQFSENKEKKMYFLSNQLFHLRYETKDLNFGHEEIL